MATNYEITGTFVNNIAKMDDGSWREDSDVMFNGLNVLIDDMKVWRDKSHGPADTYKWILLEHALGHITRNLDELKRFAENQRQMYVRQAYDEETGRA